MSAAPDEPGCYSARPVFYTRSRCCLVAYALGADCHAICITGCLRVSRTEVHRQVLLVVKDETTRGTIEGTLRMTGGFDLVPCETAAEAIRRLRRDDLQPHFVVLDWQMPGAGEILRHFVSQPRYVRSRVIVMSDHHADVPRLCVTAVVPRAITGTEILATFDRIDPRGDRTKSIR